jgi:hypothetical protein
MSSPACSIRMSVVLASEAPMGAKRGNPLQKEDNLHNYVIGPYALAAEKIA